MKKFTLSLYILITVLVCSTQAQFFPRSGDKDKIENDTKRAEKTEEAKIEKEKELEKIKKMSEERLVKFDEIREEFRKDYFKEVNDKETKEILGTMMNANINYWRARIFYYTDNISKSLGYLKSEMKENESVFNLNGSASILSAYAVMAKEFDGEELDDKTERKIEKQIKSLLEDYLPYEEKKSNDFEHYKQSRTTRLTTLRVWLSAYLSYIKQYKEFSEQIESDSFKCEPIWQLAKLLKDKLKLSLKAQEWLEVLASQFPSDPRVVLGLDKAYYYQLLAESGRIQGAITGLKTLKASQDFNERKFRQMKDDIERKMDEKKIKKEDLPADEIALLDANLDDIKKEISYYTDKLVEEYNQRSEYADKLAKIKSMGSHEANRFWSRFNDWANDLPGW